MWCFLARPLYQPLYQVASLSASSCHVLASWAHVSACTSMKPLASAYELRSTWLRALEFASARPAIASKTVLRISVHLTERTVTFRQSDSSSPLLSRCDAKYRAMPRCDRGAQASR